VLYLKTIGNAKMIYKPGQIVEGKITGIQPYGAFVALEHHVSGLIHISEISDGYVKDISKFVSVGDVVKLKVVQKAHSRNRRKPMGHKPSLPNMKMGFHTIANAMSEWIKEAKENILK